MASRLASRAVAALLAATVAMAAAPARAATDAALDRSVAYLQEVQNTDGGFGGQRDATSDPMFSAWVAMALAAAGINPRDQARPGGTDVLSYLLAHADVLSLTTDYERALLAVVAAGTDPHDFAGIDLPARIAERQLPSGAFPHVAGSTAGGVNDTAFAVLALAGTGEAAYAAPMSRALDWLTTVQNANGSWPSVAPGAGQDADVTGAVVQAFDAAARHGTPAQQRALTWLGSMQNDDGGFTAVTAGEASNTATTAWAAQGLWAEGIDPRSWHRSAGDPLTFMASMQQPDGRMLWKAGSDSYPVWMTAYAMPALAGRQLPIPTVPRAVRTPEAPAPAPATGLDSGTGPTPSAGVTAGGGGNGAPLFSRPQPQSRGTATGGVRRLTNEPAAARAERRSPSKRDDASATRTAATPDDDLPEIDAGIAKPARSAAATHTDPRRSTTAPGGSAAGTPAAGTDEAVTGKLLGRAPGTSAADTRPAAAPGLRAAGARHGDPRGAAVRGGLVTLALLAGLGIELRPRRPRLGARA